MANKKTNSVVTPTVKSGTFKEAGDLKNQLIALSPVLEGIKFTGDDKAKVDAIIDLFKNADFQQTERGVEIVSNSEEARQIYDLLKEIDGFNQEDVSDPKKLVDALNRYVNRSKSALDLVSLVRDQAISERDQARGVISAKDKEISEKVVAMLAAQQELARANTTINELSGDVYVGNSFLAGAFGTPVKDENGNVVKNGKGKKVKRLKYKRATKIATAVAGLFLTVCIGLGITTGVFASKYDAANDAYQTVSSAYRGLQGDYNDIVNYLKGKGYTIDENTDVATLISTIITDMEAEYKTLKSDYTTLDGKYEEAEKLLTKYNNIIQVLNENDYDVNNNTDVANLIQTIIIDSSGDLDKNTIEQNVYAKCLGQLVGLGLNLSDLQDENGNFTADKVDAELGDLVTDLLSKVNKLNAYDKAANDLLSSINKVDDEGNKTDETYSLSDFASGAEALAFVQSYLDGLEEEKDKLDEAYAELDAKYTNVVKENGEYVAIIANKDGEITTLKGLNEEQVKTINAQNETINQQKATIATQQSTISSQTSKISQLQDSLASMTAKYNSTVAELEETNDDLEAYKTANSTLTAENQQKDTIIEQLENENAQLKEEKDKNQPNGEQTTPSTSESGNGSNTPVGDKDPDENTHPGTGDQTAPEEEDGLGKS